MMKSRRGEEMMNDATKRSKFSCDEYGGATRRGKGDLKFGER